MPYINVQITKRSTREAKSKIVDETTNTIVNTFNSKSEHIYIVIQEWERRLGFFEKLTDGWQQE